MSTVEERIAAALHSVADQVAEADLRPDAPPTGHRSARRATRWIAPLLAAAVVVGVVALGIVLHETDHGGARVGSYQTGPPLSPSTDTTPPTTPATQTHTRVPTGTAGSYCFFADLGCSGNHDYYMPLWPAINVQQADQLAENIAACPTPNRMGCVGVPDYLDTTATAMGFVHDALGFTGVTIVTSSSIAEDQAHIGVGYLGQDGKPVTVAVLHLVRYEHNIGDTTAPWEVVGTDPGGPTIGSPKPGAMVGSAITVGGRITGPDRPVRVQLVLNGGGAVGAVKQIADEPSASSPGASNGGFGWIVNLTVPESARPQVGEIYTIVASLGGTDVRPESFSIEGVYVES